MATAIRTRYFSDHHGAGRITARNQRSQKTLPYDHAKSRYENHKAVAEALHGGPVEVVEEIRHGFRFTAAVRDPAQTVTSLRTGEVYLLVEKRGTKLLLDDGRVQFEAFAKNYTPGGEYVPATGTAPVWNGGPKAVL